MSYSDSLLASGERVVLREHQHPFILVWHARYALLAIVAAVALLVLRAVAKVSGTVLDLLGLVTLALFVVGLLVLGWSWLRYRNEEYIVSSRRLIHSEGVVNKRATDSSLEKINDAILTESLVGRMFGFGDLDVLTASESGDERLRMLHDAKSFKKAMLDAKHELELELTRPTMPPLRYRDDERTDDDPAGAGRRAPVERMRPVEPPPVPEPATAPAPPRATLPPSEDLASLVRPAPPGARDDDTDEVPDLSAPAATGDVGVAPAAPRPASPPPAAPATAPFGATTPPSPSIAPRAAMTSDQVIAALDRLGDLRDRGILTPEEFDAKKRELLDRL